MVKQGVGEVWWKDKKKTCWELKRIGSWEKLGHRSKR